MAENELLDDIKTSIQDMQLQMQSTYSVLQDTKLSGESHDKSVKITMSPASKFLSFHS